MTVMFFLSKAGPETAFLSWSITAIMTNLIKIRAEIWVWIDYARQWQPEASAFNNQPEISHQLLLVASPDEVMIVLLLIPAGNALFGTKSVYGSESPSIHVACLCKRFALYNST